MDLSPIGRAAIRAREGERLTAYRDSVGVLTISVGVTTASGLITVTPGLTITPEQSDALFGRAVERYVATVRGALKRPVPQPFFDACCSLCYNVGQERFAHSSVVLLANQGDLSAAANAFLMWKRPPEILSRRQGERDQAAMPRYGVVYARRGDRAPVREPVVAKPPDLPAAPTATAPQPAPPAGFSLPDRCAAVPAGDGAPNPSRRAPRHSVKGQRP